MIHKIRDIHPNREFIILGTGPSILDFDFGFCKDKISIGCNGIGLIFQPTYYTIFDPYAFNKFKDIFIQTKSKKILASWIDFDTCDYKLHYSNDDVAGISKEKIYFGKTVGYISMNIAYIMGASKIYLIGIDGYNQIKSNHYFSHGEDYENRSINTWTDERENIVLNSFVIANEELKKKNIELINLSPNSFLKDVIKTQMI